MSEKVKSDEVSPGDRVVISGGQMDGVEGTVERVSDLPDGRYATVEYQEAKPGAAPYGISLSVIVGIDRVRPVTA